MQREAWDSVLTTDALTCLRKFYYLHVEGWRTRKLAVDLFFGKIYATCLETYHKLRATGADKNESLIAVVRLALQETWTDGKPWDSDHSTKNRDTLIRTIVWYLDTFGDDDSMEVVHLSDNRPAVEYSFTFELTDSLIYCGHIDRLVTYQGDVFVQDQKTTARTLSSYYFKQYDHPSPQMTGYIFAGGIIYDRPVKGAVIDAAQIAVGFTRFERGFTTRTPAQLAEWRAAVVYHITLANREEYPMNPSSCDKYGGCMFREVCARDPSVRPQFLKADFEQKPLWNPLEKR